MGISQKPLISEVATQSATITAGGTWTKPAGVRFVRIEAVGGGGTGDNLSGGGYRGDAGKYVDTGVQIFPSASENFTIAIGAAGYDANSNWSSGAAGGATTVTTSLSTITANGGAAQNSANGAANAVPVNSSFSYDAYAWGKGGGGYPSANTLGNLGATQGAVKVTYW